MNVVLAGGGQPEKTADEIAAQASDVLGIKVEVK